MFFSLFVSILLGYVIIPAHAQTCEDIDSSACQKMAQSRTDFCSDLTIAKTACPKFCSLCPVVCYHCNGTVRDFHQCNTTMTCNEGQICMRKELKSIFDGHHEYELTCAEKQVCDHPWSGTNAFGKRDLVSRDVSVTCCMTDLCNYPLPPTTSCIKDLVIVVDESSRLSQYESIVTQFLSNVVSSLPISDAEVHVAFGLFSHSARTIFDLKDLNTKADTLQALRQQTFKGGHDIDIVTGMEYLLEHMLTPAAGDRPEASNVVLIISAHDTSHGTKMLVLENELHIKAEVISVQTGHSDFRLLASGPDHNFDISSPQQLQQIEMAVKQLICNTI